MKVMKPQRAEIKKKKKKKKKNGGEESSLKKKAIPALLCTISLLKEEYRRARGQTQTCRSCKGIGRRETRGR
jgi:hypothetical protein